ncbi:MAG: hypothetical protein KAI83_01600 [Thiomargarita sp.]|nr:hypothetical protein [Thiomargarita sp.]
MSNLKRTALASAMVSVLVMGAVTTAYSETSTKSVAVIADITTVTAGSKVNFSILGLNAEGGVTQDDSVIEAEVTSQRGEVEGTETSVCSGDPAKFEWDVDGGTTRYIRLDGGVGKTNISYSAELEGSDTVTVKLRNCDLNIVIGEETKKNITILPADSTVEFLDIVSFTGGDIDDNNLEGGIDGVITAGQDGAQVKIVAYKKVEMEYTFDNTPRERPTVKGVNLVEAASGLVTLELRPKKDESESIILTGDMVKGIAFVSISGIDVTAAGKYYLEATLEGYDELSSVDMYNDDTVAVESTEVKAAEDVADIVPGSASVCEHVNGHGLPFDSMDAIWNSTTDELDGAMEAFFGENNLKLYDDLGNETTPAKVEFSSPNASEIVFEDPDTYGNATSINMTVLAYDETFVGDDEVAFEFIDDTGVRCDPVTVTVHETSKLETIKVESESTTIPLNAVIPVRITTWDQNGELFVPESELELEIDGADALNVELRYVSDDGSENPELRSGEKIPHSADSEQGGRSVLAIRVGSETGTFKLKVHNGDGTVSGFIEFTVGSDDSPIEMEEECNAVGHIWVDDECKQLPFTGRITGEGSAAIDAIGNFMTSKAEFSGGWSEDGGDYVSTLLYGGGETTITQIIRFEPDHAEKEAEIIVVLAVQIPPSFGAVYWYIITAADGIVGPSIGLDITTIEPFELHYIVEGEPKLVGPYYLGVLEDLPVANYMFYFGYRIIDGDGTIYFSEVPTTLQVR